MDGWVNGLSKAHGQKRHADDPLENDQRLSKRFNLLNIENYRDLYNHVQQPPTPERRKRSNAFSDSMHLDDSRDRVFIRDLEEEVADIESEEEKLVFLPDIEKRLSKIPRSVLTGPEQAQANNELVLYSVPNSLSIPREQDKVRKAIIETRARAREKQARESVQTSRNMISDTPRWIGDKCHATPPVVEDYDPDAMELG